MKLAEGDPDGAGEGVMDPAEFTGGVRRSGVVPGAKLRHLEKKVNNGEIFRATCQFSCSCRKLSVMSIKDVAKVLPLRVGESRYVSPVFYL